MKPKGETVSGLEFAVGRNERNNEICVDPLGGFVSSPARVKEFHFPCDTYAHSSEDDGTTRIRVRIRRTG